MDKNAIKKYAVWARRELISRVSQKALQYGISEKEIVPASAASVNGVVLSAEEIKQRKALIEQINVKGYEQVMEEVAYTWFNRFIALRFMEVNGYLPSHVRVFTDEDNAFRPQIITEAINLELDGLDMDKVYAWKDANDNDALFKYLIITQCNALSPILPRMFQRIADYTELLFPDNLLREGSAIQQMIELISEDDWKDAVQIIGWLYQYYNSEPKAEVFANKAKFSKEDIPAATQLFTPDWIVRYMVENSLGRLWLEHLSASGEGYHYCYDERGNNVAPGIVTSASVQQLKSNWKYYLDEAEQEPEVLAQLATNHREYGSMTPEQIKCIDPCAGSGHILAYMFDVLVQIYEGYGYSVRDAVRNVITHNLYGLDIDERASQLAYFAVMMKARQYDRRFLVRKDELGNPDVPQPHVYAICESNSINRDSLKYFGWSMSDVERNMARSQLVDLLDVMNDAKEYGSILNIKAYDWELLYRYVGTVDFSGQLDFDAGNLEETKTALRNLVEVAASMEQKYDVAVTNPPYMSVSASSHKLNAYVSKNYPDSKTDMFAVFMERCRAMLKPNGYQAMITMHTWMFLGSYEGLRRKLHSRTLMSLLHFGIKAFEEIGNDVVQTCAFVFQNTKCKGLKARFCRLVDIKDAARKAQEFFNPALYTEKSIDEFQKIPGGTYAYWVPAAFINNFDKGNNIERYADFTGSQNITGNNDQYLRYHWEVRSDDVNSNHWVFYAKGGDYRKYYGNLDIVVDWRDSARNFYATNKTSNLLNEHFWFREGITYSAVTSRGTGFRYLPAGCVFDKGGPSIAVNSNLESILALLNSKVAEFYFQVLNPSINLQVKDIKALPVMLPEDSSVTNATKQTITLAKEDWDSFETSFDFCKHPLVGDYTLISTAFEHWMSRQDEAFRAVLNNEQYINDVFAELYNLRDLDISFEERDIPIRKANCPREIRSLISYAVGCMFGRYSLDVPGLTYAGGEWDDSKYTTFKADKDSIIPICDDEYFADDIVGRFVRFVEVVYGKDTLQENLRFIADALGGSGQPKDVIRNYFLNDFYADHLKVYQKRPIYWLFDSGKKNGFKALVYMHRYQPDTIARMRTDYVHEQQARYRTAIADLEQRIASASTAERVKLSKRLKTLQEQTAEIQGYEEKIHHLADQYIAIDLDNGVKKNYAIFGDVLAKIK